LRDGIATLEEAKKVMGAIATVECRIAFAAARAEKKIQAIKSDHEAAVGPDKTELERLGNRLKAFIESNPELFQDPRKVRMESGAFGLQTVTEVVIGDETACLKYCVENKMEDCFALAMRPVKEGLRARLEDGTRIPCVTMKTGDTAVYKVSKALVDGAREVAEKEAVRC
jgi:hypothetical protein